MAHNNKIISDEKAFKSRKLKKEGITKNMDSEARAVSLEDGFELYRAAYTGYCGERHETIEYFFASTSDKKAIEHAHSKKIEGFRCEFVNRLIIREEAERSSIIICGN